MDNRIHYSHCPVCDADDLQFVFEVKDYTVSGDLFAVWQCNSCGLRFTQNVPDQDHIFPFYQSEDYISHTNTSKGLINGLYQKVRTITMKQKASLVKRYTNIDSGNLLDIGCGTGNFLQAMKQGGWSVTGLEPDAGAREVAHKMHGLETLPSHEIFNLKNNHFNAITMWHVLEHVHELHPYIDQIKNLLTQNGKLFIAVPNYTSKDAQMYQEYWAAYDVPRHLYHFSPQAMQVLMRKHGLKISHYLPMWFDSFYIGLLSSKYKNGKPSLPAAALHGLASNIHALGNVKSCSSVIYVIEK